MPEKFLRRKTLQETNQSQEDASHSHDTEANQVATIWQAKIVHDNRRITSDIRDTSKYVKGFSGGTPSHRSILHVTTKPAETKLARSRLGTAEEEPIHFDNMCPLRL